MEGNGIGLDRQNFRAGFTLVEALAVLAIVSVLSLATTRAIISTWQLSQVNQVKAYLLSIQSMQSRSWLETGVYLPLTALPQANIDKIGMAYQLRIPVTTGNCENLLQLLTTRQRIAI